MVTPNNWTNKDLLQLLEISKRFVHIDCKYIRNVLDENNIKYEIFTDNDNLNFKSFQTSC